MKKLLLIKIFTAIAVSGAMAIEIPKGIFRVAEANQAITEAAEDEVAVAYVYFPENIKIS